MRRTVEAIAISPEPISNNAEGAGTADGAILAVFTVRVPPRKMKSHSVAVRDIFNAPVAAKVDKEVTSIILAPLAIFHAGITIVPIFAFTASEDVTDSFV